MLRVAKPEDVHEYEKSELREDARPASTGHRPCLGGTRTRKRRMAGSWQHKDIIPIDTQKFHNWSLPLQMRGN